MWRYLNFFPLE